MASKADLVLLEMSEEGKAVCACWKAHRPFVMGSEIVRSNDTLVAFMHLLLHTREEAQQQAWASVPNSHRVKMLEALGTLVELHQDAVREVLPTDLHLAYDAIMRAVAKSKEGQDGDQG